MKIDNRTPWYKIKAALMLTLSVVGLIYIYFFFWK